MAGDDDGERADDLRGRKGNREGGDRQIQPSNKGIKIAAKTEELHDSFLGLYRMKFF